MKAFATLLAIGSMILAAATPVGAQQADPRFGDGGTSPFYTWARPVPAPGTLLRQQPLPNELLLSEAGRGARILYSSTDGIGGRERIAVSGAYFTPKGKPPKGGWPLIVWAHGTVGLADVCAPSWAGRSERDIRYLNSWLEQGFAVVASDYQGLGTPGPHAYMVTRPEAYSMLDSARAAVRSQRNLSGKVILLGQSQGASAAFAAAGFAADYAPDLDIRGAVTTGTPYVSANDPEATSRGGDPNRVDPAIAYTYYLTLTVQQTRPEITDGDIYTERAAPLIEQARTMCIKPLVAAVTAAGLTRANAMRPDIDKARIYGPLLPSLLYPTLKLPVPIFMAIGAADRDVAPAGQLRLAHEACDAGTVVEAHLYDGLDHAATVNGSLKDSVPFVRRVLAGQPIAPRCVPAVEAPASDPARSGPGDPDMGKDALEPRPIALDEQARSLFLPGKGYDLTYEGQSYRVFVNVPPDAAPPEGFPMLVMLDGNVTFATGGRAASSSAQWKLIAPVLVVGVGYPTTDGKQILARRVNDLTPTPVTDPRVAATRQPGVTGGEAARFRRFLTLRLPEFVRSLAPINARCTTLYGHSLGGLFVVDTLLRAPTTYRQYFASSPSLWNDNFVVLKQQPTFAERLAHSPDQLRVELSVGGLERAFPERQLRALPYLAKMPDPKMVDSTIELGNWLKRYEGPHLHSSYKVVEGETHISVMPSTISRAVTMASECQ